MTVIPGYCVHNTLTYARGYSAEEQTRMWGHFSRLKADSQLFMDQIEWARTMKRLDPSCIVVHRRFIDGDGALHRNMSAQKFVNDHKALAAGGIVIQVLNEPNGYEERPGDLKQLATWCAEVMHLSAEAEMVVALPNFGVGHPDTNKLPELNEMWMAFKKYPMHFYACHEYGTYRGMTYTDETHQRDVTPWRVGRFKIVTDYVKQHFDYDLTILVTETGIDSSMYQGDDKTKRGWRDSGLNEVQYALEMIKASKTVYSLPNIKGLNIFSHGNTGKANTEFDWKTHDVSFLTEFQKELESYAAQQEQPPMPLPLPTDAHWIESENKSGAAYRLRLSNEVNNSNEIGWIRAGEKFHYIMIPADTEWMYGKTVAGIIGYVSIGVLHVQPPPEPPPPPPFDLRQHLTAIDALLAMAQRERDPLVDELSAIQHRLATVDTRIRLLEVMRSDIAALIDPDLLAA